jgi:hypothetical protein
LGIGGGGFDGTFSAPLGGVEPSRFSIRAESASEFIEIHIVAVWPPRSEHQVSNRNGVS